jgi:hypothetical protein
LDEIIDAAVDQQVSIGTPLRQIGTACSYFVLKSDASNPGGPSLRRDPERNLDR